MEHSHSVKQISEEYYQLGEGPHWDDSQQCLYFVDIVANIVGRYDPATKTTNKAIVGGAKHVGFVIPVAGTTDKFVIGFDDKITLIEWNGKANNVMIVKDLVTGLEPENGRVNDGKADFQGRLYTGTMLIDWASSDVHCGVLVSYSPLEKPMLTTRVKNVGLSNGLAWNEKTGKMYYADSLKHAVTEYSYDSKTGNIGEGRVVFDSKLPLHGLPEGSLPDGITIDCDGHLWIALFFGGRVVQVDVQNGEILKTVIIPTPQVTSVCFGGKNRDILYVTTCSLGPNNKSLGQPAGAIFEVTGLGAKGLLANTVRLDN
ncbi:regucalcin-like [Ctenocephalides felis]|uniref:regucalcin-like n=1 Tax=Ctenocephalides felis TaxID=7515 RepID=UPI000E6E1541|nr:regucalcin-like [Ctenocephalides felis]XP_026468276.1 regucalcin-like [Ctenocephalides felis]